jgi:VanZ family protein
VSNGTTCGIYVNGGLAKSFQDMALIGERESIRGYSLVVGNSREVEGPWTGAVLALKVYERALSEREIEEDHEGMTGSGSREGLIASYETDKSHRTMIPDLSGNENTLMVPERVALTNSVLAWPDWRNQKDSSPAGDIAVNILGFVPFGFLFAFWREQADGSRRWRSWLFAILVGGLISLGIEVTQAFIPARDSSMVDVIRNTAGASIGGLILALSARLRTEKLKKR